MTLPSSPAIRLARPNLWVVGEYATRFVTDGAARLAFIADGEFDTIPGTENMPFEAAQALVQRHNAAVLAQAERIVRTTEAARSAMTALDGELQMIEAA